MDNGQNFVLSQLNTQLTFTHSKSTIKTPERLQWCRSGVFMVNFEHI